MKLILLLLVISSFACKEGNTPPPIGLGSCVVDTWEGARPTAQMCNWGGYSWSCRWSETNERHECDRKGEALGERAK